MKYAIIIPDGAADLPLEDLGGKTPLEAARTPNMDWIASHGKIGTAAMVPTGMPCGSDVAILSVLGYDPRQFYTGRAPLEAAAQGLVIAPDEWVFRCNFVTIVGAVMEDYSAGHITTDEAKTLIGELNRQLSTPQIRFYTGVSYRHLMTYRGNMQVRTTPPHDILGKAVEGYLPAGAGSETIRSIMESAKPIVEGHEINAVRRDLGENPATDIWLWGEGKMPQLEEFAKRFGLKGAAITAVDLVRGLSALIGWDRIEVPGATGYLDTNYAGKGAAACLALDNYDIVCVHVEAPDECGHNADVKGKVQAIEAIDRHVVGPVLERLKTEGDQWRILVLPDHPTPCAIRTHTTQPVPFAMAGVRVESIVPREFNEASAAAADLHVQRGCELMEFFLTVR